VKKKTRFICVFFQAAGVREPLDPRIVNKIEELTRQGVRKVNEMKRHLENFVSNELFNGERPPPMTRRRFYPDNKDISNYISKTKNEQRHSTVDQENLQVLLEQWKERNPYDSFFFRPYTSAISAQESEEKTSFLFCYQSKNQKYLLQRYGDQMCLLDATYKTSRYALPLFFLCVKTNVSYEVVAVFIVQNEQSESIAEALAVLKQWNPSWDPRYFMVDFDTAEILALEDTFPGMYLPKYKIKAIAKKSSTY